MAEQDDFINLRDYIDVLRANWKMLLTFTAVGLLAAFIMANLKAPVYQAGTELVAEHDLSAEVMGRDPLLYRKNDDTFVETQKRIIRSEALLSRTVDSIMEAVEARGGGQVLGLNGEQAGKLDAFIKKQGGRSALMRELGSGLRVSINQRTLIFNFGTRSKSPVFAAAAANALAEEYTAYVSETYASSAQRTFNSLKKQADDMAKEIADMSRALLEAKRAFELDILASNVDEVEEDEQQVDRVREQLAASNDELFPMEDSLKRVEQQIEELSTRYRPAHPTMRDLLKQRDNLKEQIQNVKDRAYVQWKRRHLEDQKRIETSMVEEELSAARRLHELILSKIKEIDFSRDTPGVTVRILETASVPRSPSEPKKRVHVMLGTFSGLLVGLTLTFTRAHAKSRFISLSVSEELLPAPLFGSIPHVDSDLEVAAILKGEDSSSRSAEAFKALRTVLSAQLDAADNNILLVTSPERGEGKSTISTALAQSFANLGKKVLLIDVDLRKGRLHHVFGLPRDKGLSQILSEGEQLEPHEVLPNLQLIPCGKSTPHPSELLASARMRDLIRDASANYDLVIMDSPPLLAVTDASLLAAYASTRILVVRSMQTPLSGCQYAVSSLKNLGYDIHGMVLNDVQASETHHASGYYYKSYYHRYEEHN